MTLGKAAAAEAVGTALLLAIVVGSGIMGERLAQGNAAVALLANSIATGTGLYTLIVIFGPVSGAHFNPVVSAVSAWEGQLLKARDCGVYALAQLGGAFAGVAAAHAMFGLPRSNFCTCSAYLRRRPRRSHRYIRPRPSDFACFAVSRRGDSGHRCSFHYQRLLVYVFDVIRQSRRHVCPCDDRHVRGNLAG